MAKKHTQLSTEEILHLGKLANLPVNDEEIEKYKNQLTETIKYVENLEELDTSKVAPSASSAQLSNIFFEDGTKNERGLTQEQAIQNSKEKKGKYFKVGRIM